MTRVFPSTLTIHVSSPMTLALPCAERIEKTFTHRKLAPLQSFYDGMSQISSRSSDTEIHPICQLRPGGQERDIFSRRDLIRLRDIASMIAGQDKQVAWAKPFQQAGKPSIKIMEAVADCVASDSSTS